MRQRIWDATGMGVSALCLVHCLALPILAAMLPMLGQLAEAEWLHWAFFAAAAPITAVAIVPTLREKPAPRLMAWLAFAGLTLLLAGAFEFPSHAWGEGLTIAGGFSLSSAHLLNWRRRHAHDSADAAASDGCSS